MDVVKLNVYAEAYYSGAVYEEDIVISKSLYEKIKDELWQYSDENEDENAKGVYIGELDGKHSEVEGYISIMQYSEDEAADCNWELNEDGDRLYDTVNDICYGKKLDLDEDIKAVKEYLSSIDSYVEVSVEVRKSNVEKVKEYANNLDKK